MIDTWLLAAVCFCILAVCAFIRVIPRASPFDRIVAANAGATIALTGALVFGVSRGELFIIEAGIVAGLLWYGAIFAITHTVRGEPS